jgi:hypothetical protein
MCAGFEEPLPDFAACDRAAMATMKLAVIKKARRDEI